MITRVNMGKHLRRAHQEEPNSSEFSEVETWSAGVDMEKHRGDQPPSPLSPQQASSSGGSPNCDQMLRCNICGEEMIRKSIAKHLIGVHDKHTEFWRYWTAVEEEQGE